MIGLAQHVLLSSLQKSYNIIRFFLNNIILGKKNELIRLNSYTISRRITGLVTALPPENDFHLYNVEIERRNI